MMWLFRFGMLLLLVWVIVALAIFLSTCDEAVVQKAAAQDAERSVDAVRAQDQCEQDLVACQIDLREALRVRQHDHPPCAFDCDARACVDRCEACYGLMRVVQDRVEIKGNQRRR